MFSFPQALVRLQRWLRSVQPLDWLLFLIVVLALIVRTYNVTETVQFLGDQGRDALLVSRMFKEWDPVFIGPVTSVGNMYLGPLYYYFMAPFLLLSYPSPMGPVYAVVALSIATVFLMYYWGKRMIGKPGAVFAAGLIAFSEIVVTYSRFSWNPNPTPFVMLALLYATYQAWQKNAWYWVGVIALIGVIIQLHYLTLLVLGGAGVIWLLSLWQERNNQKKLRSILSATAIGVVVFGLLISPLILFDVRHGGRNAQAFVEIFTREDALGSSGAATSLVQMLHSLAEKTNLLVIESFFGVELQYDYLFFGLILLVIAVLYKMLAPSKRAGLIVILAYLAPASIGISLYSHEIYDHYILFLLPVVALLYGVSVSWLMTKSLQFGWLVVVVFSVFVYVNLPQLPLVPGGMRLSEYQQSATEIASFIYPGEVYNVVLLSGTGDLYGQNYRYFLSTIPDKEPIDPERQVEVDTLVIINEEHLSEILTLPIYQIQIFPEKDAPEVYELSTGITVTILRKTNEVK